MQGESAISSEAAKALPPAPERRLTALPLLGLIAAMMLGGLGLYRISRAFYTLTARPLEGFVAIDLHERYIEVHEWMAGRPVYGVIHTAMYPPATYVMLWPFMGWTSLPVARVIWAGTCLLALVLLVRMAVVEGLARGWQFQLLVAAAAMSNYALSIAVSSGQLPLQSVLAMSAALLVAVRTPRNLSGDLLAAALFVAAMVKPQIAIPFGWVLLLSPGRIRPALFAVVAYLALTLLAVSFQGSQIWAPHAKQFKWAATHAMEGYGNLDIWLASAGFPSLILPAWIVVLGALGAWVYFHRRSDVWILMGVAALVARMWAYHRDYDDVLLLIPLVTLCRLIWNGPSRQYYSAMMLLVILVLVMGFPTRMVRFVPWNGCIPTSRVATWITILGYLLWVARGPGIAASAQSRKIGVA